MLQFSFHDNGDHFLLWRSGYDEKRNPLMIFIQKLTGPAHERGVDHRIVGIFREALPQTQGFLLRQLQLKEISIDNLKFFITADAAVGDMELDDPVQMFRVSLEQLSKSLGLGIHRFADHPVKIKNNGVQHCLSELEDLRPDALFCGGSDTFAVDLR